MRQGLEGGREGGREAGIDGQTLKTAAASTARSRSTLSRIAESYICWFSWYRGPCLPIPAPSPAIASPNALLPWQACLIAFH